MSLQIRPSAISSEACGNGPRVPRSGRINADDFLKLSAGIRIIRPICGLFRKGWLLMHQLVKYDRNDLATHKSRRNRD